MSDFGGRVAFVTGAAGGIGRASALAFAARGATVIAADITDAVEQTVAEVRGSGGTAHAAVFDLGDTAAVREAVDGVVRTHGRIDFAHNNAGTFSAAPLAELDDADFERVVQVNLVGTFACMKHQLRHMSARGFGRIVNTASIWSFVGAGGQAAYVASKHGVAGLTRAAAIDYGTSGVRINAVAPGPIATAMTASVPTPVMDQIISRTTTARIGQPAEIAQAVVWLCSDESSYVNGAVLPVDGGWLAA
ncbi:MAG TPA: SDR family NAD(P)-dependent oxidoreductase [Mycobacterium sp.]|nr:SDR family NAD(P)-dependent oxidoreductase [Mycobacterium sp.]